jgi:hypothetical protein
MSANRTGTIGKLSPRAALAMALMSLLCGRVALADETSADRRARLESMDAEKREQLAQNYERFLHLDPHDRDRLRQLDAALETAPDREELRQVMQRYHEWLNDLPASQRLTLAALPAEDRLKRVEEIRGFQGHQRHKLNPQDVEAVSDWARKHDVQRKWFEAKRNGTDGPVITAEALAELRTSLSEESKRALDEAPTDDKRRALLTSWVFQTRRQGGPGGFRAGFRMPSEEEMQAFFKTELRDDERAYLRALPADQMQRELAHLWREKHAKPGEGMREKGDGRPYGPGRRSGPRSDPEKQTN